MLKFFVLVFVLDENFDFLIFLKTFCKGLQMNMLSVFQVQLMNLISKLTSTSSKRARKTLEKSVKLLSLKR